MNKTLTKQNVSWAPTPNEIHMMTGVQNFKDVPEPVTSSFVILSKINNTTKERELLLVNVVKRGWDIPGGHREADETPLMTILRETEEETGLALGFLADKVSLLGWLHLHVKGEKPKDYKYPYPDTSLAVAHLDLTDEIADLKFGELLDYDEISELKWFTFSEASILFKDKIWSPFLNEIPTKA